MRKDICRHYSGSPAIGMGIESCRAGVMYEQFDVDGESKLQALPCFSKNGLDTCDKREFPSQEEIEIEEAEIDQISNYFVIVKTAILIDTTILINTGELIEGKGYAGSIPCPRCENGTVRYAIAAHNHHINASCSTDGCVSWRE